VYASVGWDKYCCDVSHQNVVQLSCNHLHKDVNIIVLDSSFKKWRLVLKQIVTCTVIILLEASQVSNG